MSIDVDALFTVINGPATSADASYKGLDADDVTGTNFNVDASEDYIVSVTVGGPIEIIGPANAFEGLYILDAMGHWIFLENVTLDATGNGVCGDV